MSKSSTASSSKIATPLPLKSAWSRGPPQTSSQAASPRSQSPAQNNSPTTPFHQTHSRRSSTLGQGVPIKDGVSVARSVGAFKQGSAVTFGSIDDVSAPISSSPAATPAIKAEGVKTFGTVPAAINTSQVNGKTTVPSFIPPKPPLTPSTSTSSAISTPSVATPSTTPSSTLAKPMMDRRDIAKLFQGGGSNFSNMGPSTPSTSDTASPSLRPSNLPQQQNQPSSSQHQQSPMLSQAQFGAQTYSTFVPAMRPPPQQNGGSGPVPRSPVNSRQIPNGNGFRTPSGPNGPGPGPPPMSAGLSSPRLTPHHHPSTPSGMPSGMPPSVPGWSYYYPGLPMDQQQYMHYPQYYMPQPPIPHQHQHPHQQHPHLPPPGSQGPPPLSGMSMSPRPAPMPLQGPGTPTQSHAPINTAPSPLPQLNHTNSSSLSGLSSPPPTPSSPSIPMPGSARLNPTLSAFVPRQRIVIKNAEGQEVDLRTSVKQGAPPSQAPSVTPSHQPRKPSVRIESEDAKKKRVEEEERLQEKERAKQEAEEKERKDKEEKVKKEEERVRKEKEEAEELKKREEEQKEKDRIRKEKEDKERRRVEAETKERLRKEAEEAERVRKEAERVRKEAERRQLEEAEKERIRKEEEEKQRLQLEEEQKQREEEEEKAKVVAAEVAAAAASAEAEALKVQEAPEKMEEGEVEEQPEAPTVVKAAAPEEIEDKVEEVSTKDDLRINTAPAAMAPPSDLLKRRPGKLDLSSTRLNNISAPLPSALATARIIDDLDRISYPEGVMSPKLELNVNAKDGKFRYDRDFLLQFMLICRDKPDMLPPLDAIGLNPVEQNHTMSRGGSGRHRQASNASTSSASRPNIGLGISTTGFNKSTPPNGFSAGGMGQFGKGDGYNMAGGNRAASVGGQAAMQFAGRPSPMARSASQGGPGSNQSGSVRTRSKRGVHRPPQHDGGKAGGSGGQQGQGSSLGPSGPMGNMFEPVAPLAQSDSRWVPTSNSRKPQAADTDTPEVVDRKVKGLLNKLTMEKFDSISDQIIAWANKSEKEKDGRTLIQVIKLVFEKATDEATWSEMYARLCRKMMEQISPQVQDDGIKNTEGKPITGGQLFRKYLLNRCQEDFERGWVAKEATAAAAASKAIEDQATKAANAKSKDGDADGEVALYSDEYYAAQKAKRQGLGLIKFIGELFKLQMLTERIMHECVKKLLGNVENPEEEEIESLCKLLATVGAALDTTKARAHMDVYFSRMKELTNRPNVSSRMQFMLQDVIELRERRWVTRNLVAAPTTIAQIHEAAAKEKAAAEKESYQRQMSMSRGGSRRGGDRGEMPGPDGWAVAGNAAPRPPPKVGDLSNFGKINKAAPMSFGPSSVFTSKKDTKREAPLSRTSSSSNMFSMLQNSEIPVDAASSSKSRPPSRNASIDLGHAGVLELPAQRRKLVLAPRSKPVEEGTPAAPESGPSSEDGTPSDVMSEADAMKKINEDLKEFFAVRSLEEAEVYFTNLPEEHRFRLVEKMVSKAVESKEADAQLVADLFTSAASKDLCSPVSFEEGFMSIAEFLEDIAIDAPKAFDLMAIMMKGAGLNQEQFHRIAAKSTDGARLLALLS